MFFVCNKFSVLAGGANPPQAPTPKRSFVTFDRGGQTGPPRSNDFFFGAADDTAPPGRPARRPAERSAWYGSHQFEQTYVWFERFTYLYAYQKYLISCQLADWDLRCIGILSIVYFKAANRLKDILASCWKFVISRRVQNLGPFSEIPISKCPANNFFFVFVFSRLAY